MKRLFSLFVMLSLCSMAMAQTTVGSLRVNRMSEPQGVEDPTPMFSWIIQSTEHGVMQSAYEIAVYNGETSNFMNGLAFVVSDAFCGYIDKNGRQIIPKQK